MKHLLTAIVLSISLALGACGFKAEFSGNEPVKTVQNYSKPNAFSKALANDLKAIKEELAVMYEVKILTPADIVGTEGNARRATEYLEQANTILAGVERDRVLAENAPSESEKASYLFRATAAEAVATEKLRSAENEIKPLRELRDRVRGIVIPARS